MDAAAGSGWIMNNTDTDALAPVAEAVWRDDDKPGLWPKADAYVEPQWIGNPLPVGTKLYGPDTIERLTRENAALKTVMVAAAEEIHAHWQAHCDAEGYGPQNLMRRLEEGIPSEYGYTAGAFAELTRERDEAVARERERCAAICESVARQYGETGFGHSAERAANVIRTTKATT
jgi:hypothetical protein